MTQEFSNQTFEPFYDDGGHVFSDLVFQKCRFRSSSISITKDPKFRSTIRNVKLIQCEEVGCALDTALVEDVLVDGFKTSDVFQTWGAVFKHVKFRGKVGDIMTSPAVATGMATPQVQRAFDAANETYYRGVDWALDIQEAEFVDANFRGVPARLVRRDPETQVVVTRERVLKGEWRDLDLSKTYWKTALETFLKDGRPDEVFVAPKLDRSFKHLLDGLKMLQDAGVVE